MAWPDSVCGTCGGMTARSLLTNIIRIVDLQYPGDPAAELVKAKAVLCRANQAHGNHDPADPNGMCVDVCNAYGFLHQQPPNWAQAGTELDHPTRSGKGR